ncbi:hypothetical protein PCASD_10461 [Puccinia coronata f. sp. avenae]|uniref:Uncharacterized protein n=1 Tax=Puccinia coronata f. sp. avenae TaxID=200324 RepID=A0A2N5UEJ6_9BASI|nr:hypothetical protein PCASD_10461 [Puccinia coronata f. sp. avenae]
MVVVYRPGFVAPVNSNVLRDSKIARTNLMDTSTRIFCLVQSAGTDHAPDLLDELGCILILCNRRLLHRLPQLYAELVRSHNSALVIDPLAAYKSNTPQKPNQQSMAALRDLASVADATSYLANDIPVPYYPDQEPENDWMAMKLEAVEDFLREQEVYSPSIHRTQPDPEPATAASTAKGKERARSPAVKTESATALPRRPQPAAQEASASAMPPMATPAVAGLSTDRAPFVNLAARTETLHVGPRASSIEYLASRHPDATDDDDSTDDEPSASKRPRLVSPTPSPQAPLPDYLALTPSEIDRLLHDARPFRYRFVYTPDHIRGIADDILRELSAFLSFYAPASEQEAAARIYLYRAFQSHFNRRL